jgi:hypothetical protein
MSQPNSPKIVQKLALRTAALLFVAAGIFLGIRFVTENRQDYDPGVADTEGWITAIESKGSGSQAVVFDRDGKEIPSAGYKEGAEDKDPVWRPDGNRIFFISDREENNFHIYRWNLSTNDVIRRTVDKRSYAGLQYDPSVTDKESSLAILVSRGLVFTFDPKTGETKRIIPTTKPGQPILDEAGQGGGLGAMYSSLGTSFKEVRWALGGKYVAGVLRSEAGEVLVLQNMEIQKNGDLGPPQPIVAAERIDFDVSSNGKELVFAAAHMKPLEEIVEAATGVPAPQKPPKPQFKHVIGRLDLENVGMAALEKSNDDKLAYSGVVFSPDASMILFTVGTFKPSEGVSPNTLCARSTAGGVRGALLPGEIFHPRFDVTGQKVVFLRRKGAAQQLVTAEIGNPTGTEKVLGASDAVYSSPSFSPQTKSN